MGQWIKPTGTGPDNITLDYTADNKLEVKNGGLTVSKFNSSAISTVIPDTGASADKLPTEDVIRTFFDMIYPIGSYAFGQHPSLGTWEEVTGDRAIWLKSGTADGTTITQALPKPSITTSGAGKHSHDRGSMNITGWLQTFWSGFHLDVSGAFITEKTTYNTHMIKQEGEGTYHLGFDASKNWTGYTSEQADHTHTVNVATSGAYGTGDKVQPDAIVMTVYKRTA